MVWALFAMLWSDTMIGIIPNGYVRVLETITKEECEIARSKFIEMNVFKENRTICLNVLPGITAAHLERN